MNCLYRLYGITIRCNRLLPGFPRLDYGFPADVTIDLSSAASPPTSPDRLVYDGPTIDAGGRIRVWAANTEGWLVACYDDTLWVAVNHDATRVSVHEPPGASPSEVAVYIAGPVLGIALMLRGIVCLHAGAVVVADGAIVMAGSSGAGKSTLTAAMNRRGFPVLSDNVTPLVCARGSFRALRGYPRVHLHADSAQWLFESRLPRISPRWTKQYLDLSERRGSGDEAATLRSIYVLDRRRDDDSAPCIEAVPSIDRLLMLLATVYANYLWDALGRGVHLGVLGSLANSVPIRRVVPHTDPKRINALIDLILDDLGNDRGEGFYKPASLDRSTVAADRCHRRLRGATRGRNRVDD